MFPLLIFAEFVLVGDGKLLGVSKTWLGDDFFCSMLFKFELEGFELMSLLNV